MSDEWLNQLAYAMDLAHALKGETFDFIAGQEKRLFFFSFLSSQKLQSAPEPSGLISEPLLRGLHSHLLPVV